MHYTSLHVSPTEGDLVFPFGTLNSYGSYLDYWGLELDSNLGMYTDHTFDISEWISTSRTPSGRVRFILLRDFRCEWNSHIELFDSSVLSAQVQLHLRFRDPANDSSLASKSPIFLPSFRIGNHVTCSALEKSILSIISQVISPVITKVASEVTSENIKSTFWDKLRHELPRGLQNHRWLGFYGNISVPENISFRSIDNEKFVEPKIRLKLYEKPKNRKEALLGYEPLTEIPIQIDQNQFYVCKEQILKILFQFRSKSFVDILHLEPVNADSTEISEYRYPKYQNGPILSYDWNLLLNQIGVPWSQTTESNIFSNVFEKDPRDVIFPENLVGDLDPKGLMFTSSFGYEIIFIIVSPARLPQNWFNQEEVGFENWVHTEESKMGQIPVAHLVKLLRGMLPRGVHIYNYVFKNS